MLQEKIMLNELNESLQHSLKNPWTNPFDQSDLKQNELFSKNLCENFTEKIDSYFTDYFQCPTLVFPSGRSAISVAFQFLKLQRGDKVFIPNWSSHCLTFLANQFGNSSYHLDNQQKIQLAVHKFALPHRVVPMNSTKIIEDSIDTYFASGENLFYNNGLCEIISLSKTLSTFSGGLLITSNPDLYQFGLKLREASSHALAIQQFLKKISEPTFLDGVMTGYWGHDESYNFRLSHQESFHIYKNLEFYNSGFQKTKKRFHELKTLCDKFSLELLSPNIHFSGRGERFGTAAVIKDFPLSTKTSHPFLNLKINSQCNYHFDQYSPHTIIPLHRSISEETWESILEYIKSYLEELS